MNFNRYYQSFNNRMYEPSDESVWCVIFTLDKDGNKSPYLDVFCYQKNPWSDDKEFVWYPVNWNPYDDDEEIEYLPIRDDKVVEFLPIYPLDKYPAKRRNNK
jgi:hypothetical protein